MYRVSCQELGFEEDLGSVNQMKKQLDPPKEAPFQLRFELQPPAVKRASATPVSIQTGPSTASSSVVDLVEILNQRAAENDRALLKSVQSRAEHLSDCLLKRRP